MKNNSIHFFILSAIVSTQPSIDLIEPAFGGIASTITISGNNFSSNSQENTLFFGGLEANIFNSTENEIIVTVPHGAYYTPISVYTNGIFSISSQRFNVTFNAIEELQTSHFSNQLYNPYLGAKFYDIKIADLNMDSTPEIVVSNWEVEGLRLLHNILPVDAQTDDLLYDINNDGVVNDSDFVILLSLVINGNDSVSAADIYFDSAVDIFDLLLLSDYLQNM